MALLYYPHARGVESQSGSGRSWLGLPCSPWFSSAWIRLSAGAGGRPRRLRAGVQRGCPGSSRAWSRGRRADGHGSGLAEQGGDGDFEALEQAGAGTLAGMPAAHQLVGAGFQAEDFDRPGFGVNEPVFAHAVLLVEVALVNAVAPARSRRDDLGD